ncbi:MAG: PepSY domain-containing protein [Methylophilaceae bacterium]|nr:PepSY domain-containing protein [Methylophilales bacterium]
MKLKKIVVAISLIILSTSAFARITECTDLDNAHWINQEELQKILSEHGYKVVNFKLIGNCYKVHLVTKDGKKIEGVYNPVGGHPMKRQVK